MHRRKALFFMVSLSSLVICLRIFWKIETQEEDKYPRKVIKTITPQCNDHTKDIIGYESENRDESLIVYSRVPKCGSSTFVAILEKACKSPNISKYYSTKDLWPVPEKLEDVGARRRFVATEILPGRPYIFTGHLSFLDFTELGYEQPLYIDLVRRPVERAISLYYYTLNRPTLLEKYKLEVGEKNQTIDMCIKRWIAKTGCSRESVKETAVCLRGKSYAGCDLGRIISSIYPRWFSGRYVKSSLVSVQRAKTNIEKYYTFIGINEYFIESLRAMETLLPKFSNELSSRYSPKRENIGHNIVRPSNENIRLMQALMADDYELYEFIRRRFFIHLKCLGIPSSRQG